MEKIADLKTKPFFVHILLTESPEIHIWAFGIDRFSDQLVAALKALGVHAQVKFCSPCG